MFNSAFGMLGQNRGTYGTKHDTRVSGDGSEGVERASYIKNDTNLIRNGSDYDSSAIESAYFDPNVNEAHIKYTSGDKTYDFPCSQEEFDDLKNSFSKGKYVAYNMRRY